MNEETKKLMVKGSTPVRELAGSIAKCYEDGERNIEYVLLVQVVSIRCIRLLQQHVPSLHRKVLTCQFVPAMMKSRLMVESVLSW